MAEPEYDLDFPLSAYDKARLAAVNAARGKPSAAFRTVFQPDTLSPSERTGLAHLFGDHPLINAVVDTITNPFVLIGLALNFRYPLKHLPAGKVFEAARTLKGRASGLSWWTKTFGTYENVFRDLPRVRWAGLQLMKRLGNFQARHTAKVSDGLSGYRRATGHHMTPEVDALAVLIKQDLHRSSGGELAKGVYQAASRTLKRPVSGALVDIKAVQRDLGPLHFKALMDYVKSSVTTGRAMGKEVLEPLWAAGPQYIKHLNAVLASRGLSRGDIAQMLKKTSAGKRQVGKFMGDTWFPLHQIGKKNLFATEMVTWDGKANMMRESAAAITAGKVAQTYQGPLAGNIMARTGIMIPDLKVLDRLGRKGYLFNRNLTALKDFHAASSGGLRQAVGLVYESSNPETLGPRLRDLLVKSFDASPGPAEQVAFQAAKTMRVHGYQRSLKEFLSAAGSLGEVGQYEVSVAGPMRQYLSSMAQTYGTVVPAPGAPGGMLKVLQQEAAKLNSRTDPRHGILTQDYMVRFAGLPTDARANQLASLRDKKFQYYEWLQTPVIAGLMDKVPGGKGLRQHFLKTLSDSSTGAWSPAGVDAGITELLYHGALGFSVSAPAKNMTQTLLGTVNVIGLKATAKGYARTMKGIPRYLRLERKYRKQGMTMHMADERAFGEAFPEFTAHGLGADPMLAAGVKTEGWEWATGAAKTADAFKFLSMAMFRPSERIQRLVAWYGGQARAANTGLTGRSVQDFAANLVRHTQFPSGILGTPRALLGLPSFVRQFTQFPARQANFLLESTRYGGGQGRNFGTLGRAMVTSGVAYEAGKHILGLDLSDALMVGAMPQPGWESSPFYPMPLVPPAVGIAGGVAKAVHTGEYRTLPRTLSILAPGGLAASRAFRSLSPTRADYHQYAETGKIPVYNSQGFLQGRYTPTQLFMKSIGIRTVNASSESEMTSYLIAQKERLREYRRAYLEALARNDVLAAEKVNKQYQEQYPELGPLKVKKSDIRAYRNRQSRTRLERILAGMPKEAQPMFREVARLVEAGEVAQQLEQGGEYLNVLLGQ